MNASELRGILDRYTNENVRIKRKSKADALEVWEEPVGCILNNVAGRDERFQIQKVLASGSFYERLKVKEPDEFDMMLVMKNLQAREMEPGECPWVLPLTIPPGFTRFFCVGEESRECWKKNGCLNLQENLFNATQMKAVFCAHVRTAVEELKLRNISVRSQGPAVTLKVNDPPTKKEYSIDLTLAVKNSSWPTVAEEWRTRPRNGWPSQKLVSQICTQGCHMVAKQPKPGLYSGEEEYRKLLWRDSFSEAEKTLFREGSQGQVGSCQKQVLRILKALRLDLNMGPLKSYHLKTIMLYECEAYPHYSYWSHDKLQDRFYSAIMRLFNCLRQRNCPHYFIKSLNLFESFENYTQLIRTVEELATSPSQKIEQILGRNAYK